MSEVYKAIAAVQADLARDGISKGRRNQQQGYQFRGIDDVFNAISPLLAKHGLCILPRVLSRGVTERTTAKGGVLFYVTIDAEFDFVAASDGSTHTVRIAGEAMDSADKATNKAMSAAYKYAALMTFAIPTEGDNDADATTHEIAPPARINEQQIAELERLIGEARTDTLTFCHQGNVRGLADIAVADFEAAKGLLTRRIAKIREREQQKEAA